ncbi:MAG TPA: hypothetical protein VH257_00655 [Chloroflexota bacterium]|nr:hypothetical protein [Chloroflexota bacterium]
MNRKLNRPLLSVALAGSLLGITSVAALADALPQAPAVGEVVALEGTPHLFVRDANGALHLVSDPRALADQHVDWLTRKDVTLDQLRQFNRGEPFLSLALVKIGDAIYLPQAPLDGRAPVLRLIKSPADLALLGVSGENYGRIVLEQEAWEARYGLSTSALQVEDLSLDGNPAVGPANPQEATPTETESATA